MFIRTANRQQENTHSPMADPTGGGGSATQPVSAQQPAQPVSAQPDTLQIGGLTVQLVGAGKGRHRQTSGIWKHVVEFTPPTAAGENVTYTVKRTLPAVDTLPEREVTCGHLMKYVRANPSKSISSGGTKSLWNHFKTSHPHIRAEEMSQSAHSTIGRKKKAAFFSRGKRKLLQDCLR